MPNQINKQRYLTPLFCLLRQNVASSLSQKVTDGTFDLARAKEIAGWLFVDNPKNLFKLDRFLS